MSWNTTQLWKLSPRSTYVALEYRKRLLFKGLYGFYLWIWNAALSLHWKMSCVCSQGTACVQRVRSQVAALCISRHLEPLVALPTGKKEAAAGHAPDLCWAVASIVGKTNSLILDHIAACSKASCIPQLFHKLLRIWERICQLLGQLYLHLLLLCSNQGR